MGLMSSIFGSSPETSIEDKTILSPGQEKALNRLLTGLAQPGEGIDPSQFALDPESTQLTSLQAIEDRVLGQPSDMAQAGDEALLNIINRSGPAFDDFYETNIAQPLTQQFTDVTSPQISRDFGGSNFFSTERARADDRAIDDLQKNLIAGKSKTNLSMQDLILNAVGQTTDRESNRMDELFRLFDAGNLTQTGDLDRQLDIAQFNELSDDERIKQLLLAISTPTLENVAITSGGGSGIFGSLSTAASGTDFSKFFTSSDRRLKKNIHRIGTLLSGLPLYVFEYIWGEKSIGVMAQECLEIFPEAVYKHPSGYLMVDYGQIS